MRAAIVGAGVIGRGWAARFILHGWDVVICDPAPDTEEHLRHTLKRARTSLRNLYQQPLPAQGRLDFVNSLKEAAQAADWLQESLPESLTLKRAAYEELAPHLPAGVPLASSTSGFRPSALAENLDCTAQLLVCHPFNPVYLLPAVEVIASPSTTPELVTQSLATLRDIGMHPTQLHQEIDAHVADRLLEALWREALWLVKDGIATTEQIDNLIRYGFGLRWAQMGLFETYRIAGGEAGMPHFLEQFGPALKWPWSRLTDVPEMDAALIDTIARQSDQQSAPASIAELETRRDQNLVAIMRALRSTDEGVGQVLNRFLESQLR